jgi:hypothetical protein
MKRHKKIISVVSCPSWDSNQALFEHKLEASLLEMTCLVSSCCTSSVWYFWTIMQSKNPAFGCPLPIEKTSNITLLSLENYQNFVPFSDTQMLPHGGLWFTIAAIQETPSSVTCDNLLEVLADVKHLQILTEDAAVNNYQLSLQSLLPSDNDQRTWSSALPFCNAPQCPLSRLPSKDPQP